MKSSGRNCFRNEIAWYYYNKMHDSRKKLLPKAFDQILCYVKSKDADFVYNALQEDRDEPVRQLKRIKVGGKMINDRDKDGNIIYQEKTTRTVDTVWRIRCLQPANKQEWVHYNTQKPVDLIQRILHLASNPGDLVLDAFMGSGTTAVACERSDRRWIACDLGRFSIHTTRKRLLEEENCKPFDVLNLGKYERQYWQGVTFGDKKNKPLAEQALYEYLAFILKLYGAQPVAGMAQLHGKKGKAMVHIGSVDAPVTIAEIDAAVDECAKLKQGELHVLGWEWEMGLYDLMVEAAKKKEVKLLLLQIPREVMEQQAAAKGDVRFFELAYLEAKVKKAEEAHRAGSAQGLRYPQHRADPRGRTQQGEEVVGLHRLLGGGLGFPERHLSCRAGWPTARARSASSRSPPTRTPTKKPGKYRILVKVIDIFGNDTSQAFDVEVKLAMAKAVIAYDKNLPEIPGRRPMGEAHVLPGQGRRGHDRVARGDFRPPAEPTAAGAEDPRRCGYLARGRLRGGVRGHAASVRVLVRQRTTEVTGFGVPIPLLFLPARGDRDDGVAGGDRRPARRTEAARRLMRRSSKRTSSPKTSRSRPRWTVGGNCVGYVPELDAEGIQDLPPEDLRRFAFKNGHRLGQDLGGGNGHRLGAVPQAAGAGLGAVHQLPDRRAERDRVPTVGARLRRQPDLLRVAAHPAGVARRVLAEDDSPRRGCRARPVRQPLPHQHSPAFTSRAMSGGRRRNAIEALLGKKPAKDLAGAGQRSMLERVKLLKDLIVLNDEAHHVHDENLAWSQSLLAVHRALPQGLALWLDFSATPKDQNGMYFPWTVLRLPARPGGIEDRIVKAPLIVTTEDDPKQPQDDPDGVTADNVGEKYGYWLRAAVQRWKEHHKIYNQLGTRPVLFVMAEKNVYADAIGEYLGKTKEFGFKEAEILVIHTDAAGEITKRDLDKAREAARDIDEAESKVQAIVSVMMLREGWDVRSVTVVLGLRPFTATAEILPEQVIGRGLRLMTQVSPDRTQTLEVLGTRNLLNVLRTQLEAEGVGVANTKTAPPPPVIIEPVKERLKYDIAIPITKPSLEHDIRKLSDLKVDTLDAIYDQEDLSEPFRQRLMLEFATTETEVHQADIAAGELPPAHELLASIANRVIDRAKAAEPLRGAVPIPAGLRGDSLLR